MHPSCKVAIFFGFIIFVLTLTFAFPSLSLAYTFSVISGNLPPGLTLSSNGVISGVPTEAGIYTFVVKVIDSTYNEATKELTLTVREDVISPDIKVNYLDGGITLNQSDTLTVTVTLDNNWQTEDADWWLAADTPFSIWFFTFEGWTTDWVPVHQGPLFYLPPSDVIPNMAILGLPAGTYTLYAGVDTVMDGNVTWDSAYYDTVVVHVTE